VLWITLGKTTAESEEAEQESEVTCDECEVTCGESGNRKAKTTKLTEDKIKNTCGFHKAEKAKGRTQLGGIRL